MIDIHGAIDKSADDIIKAWKELAPKFYNRISKQLDKLEIENGVVKLTDKNLELIAKIQDRIDDELVELGWKNDLQNFANSIKDVDKFIAAAISEKSSSFISTIINETRPKNIKYIIDLLANVGMSTSLKNPMKDLLTRAVLGEYNLGDVRESLRAVILGNKKLGKYERYATQISRDALYGYVGRTNSIIASNLNLKNVRYTGPLVEDSRWCCKRWTDMGIINSEELATEIELMYDYSSGYYDDVDVSNFYERRGGFNCPHIATPTSRRRELPYSEIELDFGQE